jgi:hypothetical protein
MNRRTGMTHLRHAENAGIGMLLVPGRLGLSLPVPRFSL